MYEVMAALRGTDGGRKESYLVEPTSRETQPFEPLVQQIGG